MLMTMNKKQSILLSVPAAVVLMASCGGDPNSPGIEYFPDMYRSPAVEAYVDYGQDPYYFGDSLAEAERNTPSWRLPPPGTIPFAADQSKAAYNFPYPYPDDSTGYGRAGRELHSPIPFTQETADKGKIIYEKFCVHCHGATGQGDGPVITNGGHPPPGAYNGALKDLPEGKMFHTLTYGKNMMGSHASQLSKEERWTVIQYVKYLQNGGKMTRDGAAPAQADAMAAAPAKKN
jgi:mono/diheme cytochrome c family protein